MHFGRNARALLALAFVAALSTSSIARESADTPEWKEEISRGFFPYHHLAADDFPVDDAVVSPSEMNTRGFFHYTYHARWTNEPSGGAVARVTDLTVRSGFDRNKSWKRSHARVTPLLLEHEQGHLDLNELHTTMHLRVTLQELPVGRGANGDAAMADLATKLQSLADDVTRVAQIEQDRYDAETDHGRKPAIQHQWTSGIASRLASLHITTTEDARTAHRP